MNRDRTEGTWKQFHGKLKEQWGRLIDDSQREAAGRREELAGRIQKARGIARDEAARQLRDFQNRNRQWDPSNR